MRVPVAEQAHGLRAPEAGGADDPVALAEIELCGELMIAASRAEAAGEERLSAALIDEVLRASECGDGEDAGDGDGGGGSGGRSG